MKRFTWTICLLAFFLSLPAFPGDGVELGVYDYVLASTSLEFDEAEAAIVAALEESPFELSAQFRATAPDGCAFRSTVFVVFDPDYATRLLDAQPKTGPYAIPLRLNLFEDERGTHVSMVNPASVNRTILLDEMSHVDFSLAERKALRDLVVDKIAGKPGERSFGPMRDRGYIGKTMGVMAGGPFDKKIVSLAEVVGDDLDQAVGKLESRFANGDGEWGLKRAYTIRPEGRELAILGVTSPRLESRSFSIVKAGSDRDRKDLQCPGTAHAAAYPIEIVVAREGDRFVVSTVESMYRMKMYFEDAGKWAFMKNMGMPGSIQDEIESKVSEALER